MGVGEGLTLVPVPWASMYSRDSGATPAGSYMEHNSCFWASPEGKVTPVGWARPQHPTRCPCRAWGPLPPAPTLLLVAICVGAGIQDGGVHPPGQGLPGQQHSQYGLRAAVAFPWGQRAPQAEPGPQARSSGWQCGMPCSWQSSGSGIGGRCPVAPCPLCLWPAPSPPASKDLQEPSVLSMPSFMNCTEVLGFSSRLMPPTMAAEHCPLRMAW